MNLYSYGNARLLGLIMFIGIPLTLNFVLFIYDYLNGYIIPIREFLRMIQEDIYVFICLILPIAFIVTILVTISNLKLLKKEGKRWTNLLGTFLGGFFCLATIVGIFSRAFTYDSDVHNSIIIDYYYSVAFSFIIYLECVFIGTLILVIKSSRRIPKYDKDCIIILGCRIKKDGTLTNLLKARVDRAIEFDKMQKEETGKDIIYVPSGGKGSDEPIAEAQAMKNYLIQQGIKEENILIEDKSKNTYDNMKFSNKIIKENVENARIAFSTTNYHVFRAGVIATNQNIQVEGIGAKTKTYYWINAFIREFVATLVSEKKKHIRIFLVIMAVLLLFGAITYILVP